MHIALRNSELVAMLMFKCLSSSLVSTVSFAPIKQFVQGKLQINLTKRGKKDNFSFFQGRNISLVTSQSVTTTGFFFYLLTPNQIFSRTIRNNGKASNHLLAYDHLNDTVQFVQKSAVTRRLVIQQSKYRFVCYFNIHSKKISKNLSTFSF